MPDWYHGFAIAAVLCGFGSALIAMLDLLRRPQPMPVMNAVWPLTALYAGPIALWGYYKYGRGSRRVLGAMSGADYAFSTTASVAALCCGAGCTIGVIAGEWLVFYYPAIAVWFGWHSLFDDKIVAVWLFDAVLAAIFGMLFQYIAFAKKRRLSPRDDLKASLKADTWPLLAFFVGLFGFMAYAQFRYFEPMLGVPLVVRRIEFWYTMQLAMIAGFIVSYPVNWWLVREGIKEELEIAR